MLCSEVGSVGAFRMVVFFDERVERCPGCDLRLYSLAIKPSDVVRRG
jgi:hypothetical protein